MNKIKTIIVCSLIILIILTLWEKKEREDFKQRALLALEIQKAVEFLIVDLPQAQENSIKDVPADGIWYHHIAFDLASQGVFEYLIKDGSLFRINKGKLLLIADNIGDLRIRRYKNVPNILEIQIEAHKNVSLISNLRLRIR